MTKMNVHCCREHRTEKNHSEPPKVFEPMTSRIPVMCSKLSVAHTSRKLEKLEKLEKL